MVAEDKIGIILWKLSLMWSIGEHYYQYPVKNCGQILDFLCVE